MRRWRLEDAPELRSAGGQPHERRTCPLQPQVRETHEGSKVSQRGGWGDGRRGLESGGEISWLEFDARVRTRPLQSSDETAMGGGGLFASEAAVSEVRVCVSTHDGETGGNVAGMCGTFNS